MATLCICVRWHYGSEYIDVDTDTLPKSDDFLTTTEYWRSEQRLVSYRAQCHGATLDDNTLKLQLRYAAKDNPDLVGKSDTWGTSTIEIDLQARTGKAAWKDNVDTTRNGRVNCHALNQVLYEDVIRREAQIIARPEQAIIRRVLLDLFGCCALTGETTPAVLDVAHINAAKDGGGARITNCILLRTDVHRLMDSKLLSIDPDGKVRLKQDVSEHYRKELSGKRLPPKVIRYVQTALKHAGNISPPCSHPTS